MSLDMSCLAKWPASWSVRVTFFVSCGPVPDILRRCKQRVTVGARVVRSKSTVVITHRRRLKKRWLICPNELMRWLIRLSVRPSIFPSLYYTNGPTIFVAEKRERRSRRIRLKTSHCCVLHMEDCCTIWTVEYLKRKYLLKIGFSLTLNRFLTIERQHMGSAIFTMYRTEQMLRRKKIVW